MTPVTLIFSAFGPYVEEQRIDFSNFQKEGLFLIRGETGAGKTTILDGITYALYGKSSGGMRGEMSSMRCQFAQLQQETKIEFIFSVGGKTYKFFRSLRVRKKRGTGEIEYIPQQNAFFLDEQGQWAPFFENPGIKNMEAKAQELLGLSYEQFCRVVILPQGQFENFLIAKSDEKEKILVTLFNAEKWHKIADWLCSQANDQLSKITARQTVMLESLRQWDCDTFTQAQEKQAALLKEERQLTEKSLVAHKNLEEQKQRFDEDNRLFELFCQKEKAQIQYEVLTQRQEEIQHQTDKLEAARKASALNGMWEELSRAKQEHENRIHQERQAQEAFVKARELLKLAEAGMKEIQEQKQSCTEINQRLLKLKSLREIYKTLEETKLQLQLIVRTVENAKKQWEEAQANMEKLAAEKEAVLVKKEKISKEHIRLLFENAAEALARELKEGMPCPVCGSIHHSSTVKRQERQTENFALSQISERLEHLSSRLQSLETELQRQQEQERVRRGECERALSAQAAIAAQLNALSVQLDGDIPDAPALEKTISLLEEKTVGIEERYTAAQEELLQAQLAFERRKTIALHEAQELEKEKETFLRREKLFHQSLNFNGFLGKEQFIQARLSMEEIADLEKQLKEYEVLKNTIKVTLSGLEEQLAGKKKPEIEAAKETLAALEKDCKECDTSLILCQETSKRMQNFCQEYKKRQTELSKERESQERLRIFGVILRGDKGISLRRYVLGVMLTSIVNEANRLLKKVHGGRYQLVRTLEGVGRSRHVGLDLEVFDANSGEKRPVTGLSGGEKFLAALSLSLGLSSVVQSRSGGIQINCMFIDEGFGSLDENSIYDALEVLSTVRGSHRLVGIISHVAMLKENVPCAIEVKKSRRGSSLAIHG